MTSIFLSQTQKLFLSKKILILGWGREGISTYRWLRQCLPEQTFTIIDRREFVQWSPTEQAVIANDPLITLGSESELNEVEADIVFKAPGISPFHPPYDQLKSQLGGFWSNTRLFLELVADLPHITTIGVTGTKGKSTTSSCIHHVLVQTGQRSLLAGNIGVPPLDLLADLATTNEPTMVVLELSSHQLLDVTRSPHIAVILGVTSEHLDYYPNTLTYQQAKANICKFQTSTDVTIFESDSPATVTLAQSSPAKKIPISTTDLSAYCFIQQQQIYCHNQVVVGQDQLQIKGEHNLLNLMPSVVIGHQLGILNDDIARALSTFQPLRHRLEKVAEHDRITFINDSMSTTPEATLAALKAFPTQPVVLLVGGFERHQNYDQVITELKQRASQGGVRGVIGLPTTGKRVIESLSTDPSWQQQPTLMQNTAQVDSLAEAVQLAKAMTQPQDVVLLSPGAASFNQFADFADRGDQFAQLVVSK